ncbi:hypothetical protein AB9F43_32810, partial [Rhizobium leguminosarum]|uniref:hypothetical protein n=1 Tax=Rhizobium leguminosarum TaxID=384 RepID=UPI003F9B14D2
RALLSSICSRNPFRIDIAVILAGGFSAFCRKFFPFVKILTKVYVFLGRGGDEAQPAPFSKAL